MNDEIVRASYSSWFINKIEIRVYQTAILDIYLFQPKVVTATDEADLARQMEKAEAENTEVAGDDDEEDEEDEENGENHEEEDDEMDEDTEWISKTFFWNASVFSNE